MNYDRTILEMLGRIQTLEEEMKILKNSKESFEERCDGINLPSTKGQTEMARA